MPCVSVPVVPLLQLAARVWLEHGPRLFRGASVFPWEAVDRAAATGHLLEAAGKSWFLIKIKKKLLRENCATGLADFCVCSLPLCLRE